MAKVYALHIDVGFNNSAFMYFILFFNAKVIHLFKIS